MTETKIDNGGQAFPMPACQGEHGPYEGMTLRDWFAGQALNGLVVGTNLEKWSKGTEFPLHNIATRFCYAVADAMIAQRKV